MSVTILTRHRYPNYGALLQAFALQTAFVRLGCDVEVANYVSLSESGAGVLRGDFSASRFRDVPLGALLFGALKGPQFVLAHCRFGTFRSRYLMLGPLVRGKEGLKEYLNAFDLTVAGSDQVWNRIHGKLDPNYFLVDLATSSARASYAASLGTGCPKVEDELIITDWVSRLAAVSVREEASAAFFSRRGIAARADVDPVLLFDREFWLEFAGGARSKAGELLVYDLDRSSEVGKVAREIAARDNQKVVRVTTDPLQALRRGRTRFLPGLEEFVGRFAGPSMVLTNSFHGVVFSIVMGTPFLAIRPRSNVSRIEDLLRRFGLEDRLVDARDACLGRPMSSLSGAASGPVAQARADSWKYLEQLAGLA